MFKKGQKGNCVKCGKSIKQKTPKHLWCKHCSVVARKERNDSYKSIVREVKQKPHKAKHCTICGCRVDFEEEYVLRKKPLCSFCQTYTIAWNDKSFKRYWTPARIKREKERLNSMCDESIKRWLTPVYKNTIGGQI